MFEFHVVLRMGMEKYRVCLVAFSRGCNNNNDASGGGLAQCQHYVVNLSTNHQNTVNVVYE